MSHVVGSSPAAPTTSTASSACRWRQRTKPHLAIGQRRPALAADDQAGGQTGRRDRHTPSQRRPCCVSESGEFFRYEKVRKLPASPGTSACIRGSTPTVVADRFEAQPDQIQATDPANPHDTDKASDRPTKIRESIRQIPTSPPRLLRQIHAPRSGHQHRKPRYRQPASGALFHPVWSDISPASEL